MLLEFLTFILTLSFAVSCPASVSSTNRCACRTHNSAVQVSCSWIDTESELTSSLEEFKDESIYELEFQDAVLNYIPYDAFQGLTVEEITFEGGSITSLSDTCVAFAGLESSLTHLRFFHCSFANTWNMAVLKHLRVLKSLKFVNGDLESIVNSKLKSHLDKLRTVDFTDNQISVIGDYAFANLTGLMEVMLSRNKIRELKRNVFPNPADKLVYLFLSHNELMELPSDLFTNMPRLSIIELGFNKLTFLKETTFIPVWHYLRILETEGNELTCDCRMEWMLEMPPYGSFKVICEAPRHLKGQDIFDVADKDLSC